MEALRSFEKTIKTEYPTLCNNPTDEHHLKNYV